MTGTIKSTLEDVTMTEELAAAHDAALKKDNRLADAQRCEDKVRDWQSKAREIAQKRGPAK